MNFQYYETLQDKSDKYLNYLVSQIKPSFTKGELKIFLDELSSKPTKKKQSAGMKLKNIGDDYDTIDDLKSLKASQLKSLYQIFISREDNSNFGVKWRFYQYFKYVQGFIIENFQVNISNESNDNLDFVIEMEDGELTYVVCYDILDLNNFNSGVQAIKKYSKKTGKVPNRIIFAAYKTYRNIPLEKDLVINDLEIASEIWVEWNDEDRPFNGEDLLLVGSSELKIAGFNFTSIDDVLDYVYEYSDGGQISIFVQQNHLSEISGEEQEVELIWKGIMLKENK